MTQCTIRRGDAPVEVICNGGVVSNVGPATIYYSARQDVTATFYEGTLAANTSTTLDGSQFFKTDGDRALLLVDLLSVVPDPALEALQQARLADLEAELAATPPTWQPLNEPGVGGRIVAIHVSPHDPNRLLVAGDMLGVALSSDAGETWEGTTGFKSWECGSFTWDPVNPDRVWVGTLSGPYRSDDGGKTWLSKRSGLAAISSFPYSAPVEKVLILASDTNQLLAFGGNSRGFKAGPAGASNYGKVYRSTDAGETWTTFATILTNGNILNVAATSDLQTIYASVLSGGIYKSIDGGATWATANTGLVHLGTRRIVMDPTDSTRLWVTLASRNVSGTFQDAGVVRTTDSGANWALINSGLSTNTSTTSSNASYYDALHRAADGSLHVVDIGLLAQRRYKSTDNGDTWASVSSAVSLAYPAGVAPYVNTSDPNDPTVMYAGTSDSLIKSLDGGVTWKDTGSRKHANGRWSGRGFSGLLSARVAFSPKRRGLILLAGWDAANLLRSEDNGASWQRVATAWDNYFGGYDVAFGGKTGRIVYTILGQNKAFNGVGVSVDAGRNWSFQVGGSMPARHAAGTRDGSIEVAPGDGSVAYAQLTNGNVVKTTDTGTTWAANFSTALANAVAVAGDGTVYIATAGGVYSGDGTTYALMSGSPVLTRLVADPINPAVVYGAGFRSGSSNQGVWRLSAGTWSRIRNEEFATDVAVDPFDATHLVFATRDDPYHDESFATGVWESTDAGGVWSQRNSGLSMLRVRSVAFDPWTQGRLIAGLDGRGFWEIRLDGEDAGPGDEFAAVPDATQAVTPVAPAPAVGASILDTRTAAAAALAPRTFERDRRIRADPVSAGGALPSMQAWRVNVGTTIPSYNGHGGWIVNLPALTGAGIVNPSGQLDARVLIHGMGKPSIVDDTEDWLRTPINPSQANLVTGSYVVSFMHYGLVVQFRHWTRAGGYYRARVDGEYITDLAPTSVGGGSAFVTHGLDFTADGAKWRLIQIENWHGAHFNRVNIGPADVIALPQPTLTPSIYFLGDSYFDGSNGEYKGFEDMVHIASARLGMENITVDGLGGTGYITTNDVSTYPNYQTRIAGNLLALGFQPDIVVVGGSINDQGLSLGDVQAAAETTFATIAQAAPTAKIVAVVFGEKSSQIGQLTNPIAGVKAAGASSSVPVLDLAVDLTGTGSAGTPAGSGTRDVMVTSSSDPHPTAMAHQVYGERMARFIQDNL